MSVKQTRHKFLYAMLSNVLTAHWSYDIDTAIKELDEVKGYLLDMKEMEGTE